MRTLFLLNPTAGKADCTRTLPQQINAAAARAGLRRKNIPFRSQITPVMPGSWPMPLRSRPGRAGKNCEYSLPAATAPSTKRSPGSMAMQMQPWAVCPLAAATIFCAPLVQRKSFWIWMPAGRWAGEHRSDADQPWPFGHHLRCRSGCAGCYGIPKFRRIPLCGGEMAYVLSIVEQLCGHIGRRVEYTIDGETLDVDCLMCAICNGRTYGGGFCAAPEAQPDDGWLDVYIIRKVSRVTIAKLLGMYKSGKHFQNGQLVRAAEPYFIYRRAKQVSLRAADGRGPIVATADGECAPKEQITVQVQPLAGRILLPKPAFERFAAQRTAQSADRT